MKAAVFSPQTVATSPAEVMHKEASGVPYVHAVFTVPGVCGDRQTD